LLYWTPDADVRAGIHDQEWFTGYGMAKGVEFQLPLASDHGGSAPLIPKEMNPDFLVETLASTEQEDFHDLVDLALVAGHHSRYRHDPALTHAQFKSLYTAWVQNSVARQVADQIFVARRKEDGKAMGFITVKLAVDKHSASIGLLGVSPSCQRQGLGAALMSAACRFAMSAGILQITVRTQADNHEAVAFYGAQGFTANGYDSKTTYHIWLTHRVIDRVPYNVPYLTGDEVKELSRLVSSQRLDSLGRYTVACEHWLETKLGCSKALLTLSATAALEQAVLLCNIGPGDEVIMPSFTFVSTANAVALRMATPVFVDVGDDLNMDCCCDGSCDFQDQGDYGGSLRGKRVRHGRCHALGKGKGFVCH
jgi:ribosomal protein S18 acetylase RimI-like enzyme